MGGLFTFVLENKLFIAIICLLDLVIVKLTAARLVRSASRRATDAMGGRSDGLSFYKSCRDAVYGVLNRYEGRDEKPRFYARAKERLKRSGYRSKYSVVIYLFLKFILTPSLALTAFAADYPGAARAAVLYCALILILETSIARRRRKLSLKFQRCIYKVYKYLHNQISSGVKVTDAVKTVYEVSDDAEIRGILTQLSAGYELTLDIDAALVELRSSFNSQEAETLCIALKQGIATGDNSELLARQEDIMFKKYFNYIQAETDSRRLRGVAAAALFTAATAVMIIVPLVNDINDSVSKIFLN